MNWLLAAVLVIQAHFAISYLVPIDRANLDGWLPQLIAWVFPWGQGDHGLLNPTGSTDAFALGFFIAAASAALSLVAILAVFGIWAPRDWWRAFAVAGALVSVVLLLGFFEPHKVLPILFDAIVIVSVVMKGVPIAEPA